MKRLQITALILIGVLYCLSLVVIWLGVSPEVSFLEFYSQIQTSLSILVVLAPLLAIIAFILGWKPEIAFLKWLREEVILPIFTSKRKLVVLIIIIFLIFLVETGCLLSFLRTPAKQVVHLMFAGDYTGATNSLQSLDDTNEKNVISMVLEAVDQSNMKLNQSHDSAKGRNLYDQLSKKSMLFQPFWMRYLSVYAKASCLYVLNDTKAAVDEFKKAMLIAKRVGTEEWQRCNRKIGDLYLLDTDNRLGARNYDERIKHAMDYFIHDSSVPGQRELGNCYYLIGRYAEARNIWTKLLKRDELLKNPVEKKRVLNAIAMSYTAQKQYNAALNTLQEGLNIQFDINAEDQRREHIRLLGTKAFVYVAMKKSELAWEVWKLRLSIMQQKDAPCLFLLESQILASRYCFSLLTPDEKKVIKKKLINDLIKGTEQSIETFVDMNRESLLSLLEQSVIKFEKCYVGLKYQIEPTKYSLLN